MQWLRAHGHAHGYAHSMSCGVAAQVLAAVRALDAAPGRARVRALAQNTAYFRRRSHSTLQLNSSKTNTIAIVVLMEVPATRSGSG